MCFRPPLAPEGMRITMRLEDRHHRWFTWLHDQYLLPGKTTALSSPWAAKTSGQVLAMVLGVGA